MRVVGVAAAGMADSVAQAWLTSVRNEGLGPYLNLGREEATDLAHTVLAALHAAEARSAHTTAGPGEGSSRARLAARALTVQALRLHATLPQFTHSLFLLEDAMQAQLQGRPAASSEHERDLRSLFRDLLLHAQGTWQVAERLVARRAAQANLDDAEQEIDRLLEEFVSLAGHEIRTPLTSIKAYTQLAERRLDRISSHCPVSGQPASCGIAECGDHLRVVTAQTNRLSHLVNELLETSRLRTGRLQLDCQRLDLAATVAEAVATFRGMAPKSAIAVRGHDQPLPVCADAERIEQVVCSLLSNAVRFSPEGSAVEVSLRRAAALGSDGGEEAEVAVADQGMGIAPDDLPHVFERFFHSSQPEASRLAGLGLGLWLSAQIVTAHGGRIWVQSGPGQGSTFFFALPLL